MYFFLYSTENAELSVAGPMSKEEVESRLAENYYGNLHFCRKIEEIEECGQFYGRGMIIIKGDIIIPEPVQVVTKFKL